MKNARCLVAVALAVAAGLGQAGPALAQKSVAGFSKEAIDNLAPMLTKAARDGFAMEPRNTTVFGGWLPRGHNQGNEQWITLLIVTKLDPNRQYRLIVAGDNDAIDLDLRVLDPEGNVVVTDAKVSRDAEVTFQPRREQDYSIQFRLYNSSDNCICIGAMLRR